MSKKEFWMKVISTNEMHRDDIFKRITLEDVSFEDGMVRVRQDGEIVYEYALNYVKKIQIEEPV